MSSTNFKITSNLDTADRRATEAAVDADLNSFDAWFQARIGDAPLVGSEKAILKTYLYYMLYENKDA